MSVYGLPVEILRQCFRLAIDSDTTPAWRNAVHWRDTHCTYKICRTAHALSLTSSTFSHIVTPMLYADINITIPRPTWYLARKSRKYPIQARYRAKLFSRAMELRPGLRTMVRSLKVEVATFIRLVQVTQRGPDRFTNLTKLVLRSLPKIEDDASLGDHSNGVHTTWLACQQCLMGLSSLSDLTLGENTLRSGDLKKILDIPSLRRLKLTGINNPDIIAEQDYETLTARSASDCAVRPPCDYEGKAALTKLSLTSLSLTSPWALGDLLQRPKSLEVLTMGTIGPASEAHMDMIGHVTDFDMDTMAMTDDMAYPWTYSTLREVLDCQRTSLRELRLHQIGDQQDLATLDLSDFPALEILEVCVGGHGLPTAAQAAQIWLTPSLKKLVLHCTHVDIFSEKKWRLNQREVDWMDEFTSIAAQRKQSDVVGLEEMEILFDYRDGDKYYMGRPVESPESLLATAKKLVESHGIKFVHTTGIRHRPGPDPENN